MAATSCRPMGSPRMKAAETTPITGTSSTGGGIGSASRFSTLPSANRMAGQRKGNANQLAFREGKAAGAEQQRDAEDAEHQRRDIAQGRPHMQERPAEQHRPDRHGVGEQRALADRDVFHRHGPKTHPGKDVGEGGEEQPRDRLARDDQGLAAAERERCEDGARENAGEPACKQRRPLQQQQLIRGQFGAQPKAVTASQMKPIERARREESIATD
jgi:hypothetical protein